MKSRPRRMIPLPKTRRLARIVLLCLAMVGTLVTMVNSSPYASAVSAAQWNPGMIISDNDFYNSLSMNAQQVQSFLDKIGASCQPGTADCIKDYKMATTTKPADAYCKQYIGAADESAAQVIAKVSQACGINPQVLIVTLQKENSLITKTKPSTGSYRTAMGYGCPDTAACETKYYGFFNQVYLAARQFQIYAAKPGSFSHRAGQVNTVRYNPSASCGSSQVYIQNQATASLYNYTPYQPNTAALNNLYGTGDSCSAYGNRNFWTYFSDWFGMATLGVSYAAHVSDIGWQSAVSNGIIAGTMGQNKRIEALTISLNNAPAGSSITYATQVQSIGWQSPVANGQIAGTTGRSLRAEELTISLSGPIATTHDIWYRAYVQDHGWLDWASNGAPAGSSGLALRMEAVQIQLLPKNSAPPGAAGNSFLGVSVSYTAHVGMIGWQSATYDGNVAGTTGQSKPIEALTVSLSGMPAGSSVTYSSYVQGRGWQDSVSDGAVSGTTGQSLRLEAVKLALSGPAASQYSIWYRAHVQNYGWMGWAADGGVAGSLGLDLRLEAVQIIVLQRGFTPQGATSTPYAMASIAYSAHVQNIGWQGSVQNGVIAGTTGKSLRLEALKASLVGTSPASHIAYTAYVQGTGWQKPVSDGAISGTTGKSLRVETVALTLSGSVASLYDVYYRVHIEGYGWLGWASNGSPAGSSGINRRVEAIQIELVVKGTTPPTSSLSAHVGANPTLPPF